MSKGPGTTQRAILAELQSETKHLALTVMNLAERLGRDPRQVRKAVYSLKQRKLVVLTKQHAEFNANGMPSGATLFVWLPDNHRKHLGVQTAAIKEFMAQGVLTPALGMSAVANILKAELGKIIQ